MTRSKQALTYALLAASLACPLLAQQKAPYEDASLPARERAQDLVKRMTLEEKAAQMMNEAPALPRLSIAEYNWWNEGLHGMARSGYATMFPQAIGMAATWDTRLVGEIGTTISTEARAKYNQAMAEGNHAQYYGLTIWSPNINIFRDPRWGRGQETYGEDPYLTSRLGVAFVEGLQGSDTLHPKTIATPKHFAVHSGPESERHRFNVTPSPHDLEETYLPAFRATITEAHAGSLMCAYNAVNGLPACANQALLADTLRKHWGFEGFITSDCGAVEDFFTGHKTSPDAEHAAAAAVLAGTDTNCGDTYKALPQAVRDKLLPESALDTALVRLFTARFALGMFDGTPKGVGTSGYARLPFSEDDSAAHRLLATRAAEEAMVLLKNDGTLPLKPGIRTLAVIGPNAALIAAIEGNYNAIPSSPVFPVDGVQAAFASSRVVYAQGSPHAEGVALPAPRTLFAPDQAGSGQPGLKAEYYSNPSFSGAPAVTRIDPQIDFDWTNASPVPGLSADSYSVRWSGMLTPPAPGDSTFGLRASRCGRCPDVEKLRVQLDGKEVDLGQHLPGTEAWDSVTPALLFHFADTQPHRLQIEYTHQSRRLAGGLSLRWLPPVAALRAEAVAAARQADVVLAFVGLSPELEGEEMPVHVQGFSGGDRTSIDLPAVQQQLLEAVSATGKPLVVVLLNGSALAVNWAQAHAAAVLEAWYPGEAGGTAIANTLLGKNNPGGKLPLTFYHSLDDLPPFDNYAMRGRTYRYFSGKPLYGFGYGLSYTTFAYSALHVATPKVKAGDSLVVEAEVRNTGARAGDEVAELYLTPPATDVSPRLVLAAFDRVHLQAGESRRLRFTLSPRQLSQVDAAGARSVTAGSYRLSVGGSQPGEGAVESAGFTIEGSQELPR
ncbi:MAG TPA: glycoside hydrolase family 3 C-terminal domain-containing protein [Acidobacteriaceae bacterium]